MSRQPHLGCSRGFSLVEVMVALIIIAVGLLGVAKLGALMISNAGTSRVRALVALEASSLAASMHADRDYWDGTSTYWNAVTDGTLSLTGTQAVGATSVTFAGTPGTLSSDIGASTCQGGAPGDIPAACNSQDMAAYDLNQWGIALAGVLNGSTTTIGCAQDSTRNNVVTCTISVQWNENTVASNSQQNKTGAAPTAFQTQTYTLVVQP